MSSARPFSSASIKRERVSTIVSTGSWSSITDVRSTSAHLPKLEPILKTSDPSPFLARARPITSLGVWTSTNDNTPLDPPMFAYFTCRGARVREKSLPSTSFGPWYHDMAAFDMNHLKGFEAARAPRVASMPGSPVVGLPANATPAHPFNLPLPPAPFLQVHRALARSFLFSFS